MDVDKLGLDHIDRNLLLTMIEKFDVRSCPLIGIRDRRRILIFV